MSGAGALGGVDVVAGQLVLVDRDLEQVRLVRVRVRVRVRTSSRCGTASQQASQ